MNPYKNKDGCLKLGEKTILNAEIVVVEVYRHITDNGITCRISVRQNGNEWELPLIEHDNLGRLKLNRIDQKLLCMDDNGNETDKLFRNFIKCKIAEKLRTGNYGVSFSRLGWEKLPSGNHVYVAGDRIIGDAGEIQYIISPDVAKVQLSDIKGEIEKDIVRKYLFKLWRDPSVLIPLAAHLVRSLLCSVFEEAGYPAKFVTYVDGIYGSGKTTAVMDFDMIFDNRETNDTAHVTRAMGTKPAVRDFLGNPCERDIVKLADDVCTSTDAETQRKAKATAAYIIRFAADRIPEFIKGCEYRNRSGVIITGELPMDKSSDISRCFSVYINHRMTGKEKDDHIVTAAAMSRFLAYFAPRYEKLSTQIKDALQAVDPTEAPDSNPRQQTMMLELSCAFQLFLDFALKIGALSEQEHQIWYDALTRALSASLKHNTELVAQCERKNVVNIAKIILEEVESGKICLAKTPDKYSPKKHDGYRKGRKFDITLDALARQLSAITGKNWSTNRVGNALRQAGLVDVGKDEHTAKDKFKGKRFVPLVWDEVERQATLKL